MDHHKLLELDDVVRMVYRKMTQAWTQNVERGISSSQAWILELLEQRGRLRASEIAELLGITSGAVTALCDKLISAGYASRSRTEEDRRVVYVEATPEGIEMLRTFESTRRMIIQQFFQGLSDDDQADLVRIYKKVLNNIEIERTGE
ncbi:MarR family winged helix-turn-helix transcriptional regulator [Paenibacillus turpanensis]|uniref:MarR family winged helix-turn-helix transcriptional regulator n=1 Tax=Paenibacillus turpanensis TaxID=2689078 RepID=UPI00140A789E|nr:MarR family transcriptional regulator [Paenibacillus turpanensis]